LAAEIVSELSKTIPLQLARDLIQEYGEVKLAFFRGDVEAIGNHSTKFYETVLQILEHIHTGSHSSRVKIDQLLRSLEESPRSKYPESVRIIIPRVCKALFTLRSERLEHKSKDITPKYIDSALIIALCDWIVAEFLRLFHTSDESKIQNIILELTRKKLPAIEEFEDGGLAFNLGRLSASQKVLAALYYSQQRLRPAEIARKTRIKYLSTVTRALNELKDREFIDANPDGFKINSKGIQHIEDLIATFSTTTRSDNSI